MFHKRVRQSAVSGFYAGQLWSRSMCVTIKVSENESEGERG